jgi:hypothetical protein
MRRLLAFALSLATLLVGAARAKAEDPAGPTEQEREALRKMVAELREEASKIRGLAWKRDVPADLLSRAQLRENFLKEIEEEYTPEELERDTKVLRRLGLLTAHEDPIQLQLDMFQEMAGGFYDPKVGKLFIIEGMAGEAQKPVILHELVHALEDQWFDLELRVRPLEYDPDRLFAEKCLEEGSAEHARELYQKAHPDIDKLYNDAQSDPAAAARQLKVLQAVPAILITGTLLHYQTGPQVVAKAVGDDYAKGMERLYADPPVTQEQVLQPKKWFGERKDYPRVIVFAGDVAGAAGLGWEKIHELTVGELDLALYVDHFLGGNRGRISLMHIGSPLPVSPAAAVAARGWDGGRCVFVEKKGLPIGVVNAFAFDTEQDAIEAYDALTGCTKANCGDKFQAGKETEAPDGRTLSYDGPFGAGRIQRRGVEVLQADGFPAARLEQVWTWVAMTRFLKDERDTWDPTREADPLAGLDFVDKARGLGVDNPGEGWTLEKDDSSPVGGFAKLAHGDVEALIVALDVPGAVPAEMLLPMLEGQLKGAFKQFDPAKKQPAKVGPMEGTKYVLGAAPDGRYAEVYLGYANGRLLMVRVFAPDEPGMRAVDADVGKILASLVSVKE